MTNININGGNIGGLQVGDGYNSQKIQQSNGPQAVSAEALLHAIAQEVPAEVAEDTVAPLREFAAKPPEEQEQPEHKSKWGNLLDRLKPMAPQIAKAIATFSEAALNSLASGNPVVAGIVALCKSVGGE